MKCAVTVMQQRFPSVSSSSTQQQSNLIPGLNLNALGIFSPGLPVLPPAAGPRGAVPSVSPAGYNPFLVSLLLLFKSHPGHEGHKM